MFGRMIGGGGGYQSARDGLFGNDPLANGMGQGGGMGGAINKPQQMMQQPQTQPGQSDLLSTISPLGSLLMGQNSEGRNLPALLQMIGGLGGSKQGANNSIAGLLGMIGGQAAQGQGIGGGGATWMNELFTGGQGANNAGFRQTPDGMPMGHYVRR